MEIENLSEKEKEEFAKTLMENLQDRRWCGDHRINYIDPNFETAKRETYNEMFGEKSA